MSEPTPSRGRIFVVDDHELVREMLVLYIRMEADLEVCGTAASGAEALAKIGGLGCDLALLDVGMPGMSGIELAEALRARHPEVRCLMLSGHAERVYVQGALEAGARGYVMKGDPETILEAIRQVLRGEDYLSAEVQPFWGS